MQSNHAVVCLESGVDIKTLQENLGHATATFTLDIYGHVSQKMRQQSAVKLESFLSCTCLYTLFLRLSSKTHRQ